MVERDYKVAIVGVGCAGMTIVNDIIAFNSNLAYFVAIGEVESLRLSNASFKFDFCEYKENLAEYVKGFDFISVVVGMSGGVETVAAVELAKMLDEMQMSCNFGLVIPYQGAERNSLIDTGVAKIQKLMRYVALFPDENLNKGVEVSRETSRVLCHYIADMVSRVSAFIH